MTDLSDFKRNVHEPMKAGIDKRRKEQDERTTQLCSELDSTYAHLRAVIENCKHTDVAAIRHQLVGLLPEVQDLEPEVANRMRAKGMGHLADRHADLVRSNWSDFGYPDEPLAKEN